MRTGKKDTGIFGVSDFVHSGGMRTLVPPCRGWKRLTAAVCAGLMAGAFSFLPVVEGHPVLDSKGTAVTISGTTDMNITSTATNNVIKWVDFSIGKNEKVAFDAHNYLNYVTGSARSDIYGTLTGGGKIALVNPNGILIGDGAVINVGSLYLSSKEMNANGFAAFESDGSLVLNGNAKGDVINMGKLNADVITVEGNNITFKNVGDVTLKDAETGTVKLTAGNTKTINGKEPVRLGYVETGSFKDSNEPSLPVGWTVNGTTGWYILVQSGKDLGKIGQYSVKNFFLADDITIAKDAQNYRNHFKGKFDGLWHTIAFPDDSSYGCVFESIESNGKVYNLGVNTGNYAATDVASNYGSLASTNAGYMENVWHEGNVTLTYRENVDYSAGGIVGVNTGTVTQARNLGNITVSGGDRTSLGGIAGKNEGEIDIAYNVGNIEGAYKNGGIVGDNSNSVHDVYNLGAVTSRKDAEENLTGFAGGIVGYQYGGTIKNAYHAVGKIQGKNETGNRLTHSIVGSNNNNGKVQNAYYQARTADYKDPLATRRTTAEMETMTADDYTGWDISASGGADTVWRFNEKNWPILTAFLKQKDHYLGESVYDGTATGDVGAHYLASALTSTQAEGIDWASDVSVVAPKTLTLTGGVNKIYDGNTTATITADHLSGVVEGETLTVSTTSATYADKNAEGGKTVTYAGLTLAGTNGTKAGNYTIAASGTTTGNITAKEINATFADVSKTYDGTTNATAGKGMLTGVISGDMVNVTGTAAFADKNAGTNKTVNYTDVKLSGTDAGNYSIANTATGKGSIAKANITISTDAVTKTYDGTTTVSSTAAKVISGKMFDTDVISGGTFTLDSKNVGVWTVAVSDVTINDGNGGRNYNVTYQNGTGTITRKEVTATVADTSKVYDGTTNATANGNLTGVIDADKNKVAVTATGAYDDKNVGTGKTVNYTGFALSGSEAGNYNLTTTAATGTGTITRKALSLVADPVTITQGQEIPESFTGKLTGFVADEGLNEGDEYAFALEGTPDALGSYAVWGKLKVGDSDPAEYGDYGANYTFANAASNATAFTIKAKSAPSNPGGGGGTGGGTNTPSNPTNPTNPTNPVNPAPVNPVEPTPVNPAEPTPAKPGNHDNPVISPADGSHQQEGNFAERLVNEAESGHLSAGAVEAFENEAKVATEQPFAKDMAGVAEMSVEDHSHQSLDNGGHSYTMLDGGLVAVRDDVNSAPASAVMGGKANSHSANEVVEAAEQADLTIGTEEVHNRQDNSTSDEDSDEQEKKNNKSKQNTKKTETAKEATDK